MTTDINAPENIDKDYKPWRVGVSLAELRIVATSIHILPHNNRYHLVIAMDKNAEYARLIETDRVDRLLDAYNRGIEYEIATETLMAYVYGANKRDIRPARVIIAANKNTAIHFYNEVKE